MSKIEELAEDIREQSCCGASVSDIMQLITDYCQKEYEEKLRWIPVEEKLPEISTFEKYNVVNVKFKTFKTDEEMICSATLEEISQHCFENSPKHKRWFIFPSAGHELKTVTHWRSFL